MASKRKRVEREHLVDLDQEDVRLADGTRLTNEVAEQLVDEIREKAAGAAGRGRPSLTGEAATSPQIGIRVTPALHERLKARAAAEDKAVSQVIRDALERYV